MLHNSNKDLSLIEYRIDKLEQSSEELVKSANTLVTKVEVLTTKVVIGATIVTLLLNVGLYFIKKSIDNNFKSSEQSYESKLLRNKVIEDLEKKIERLTSKEN